MKRFIDNSANEPVYTAFQAVCNQKSSTQYGAGTKHAGLNTVQIETGVSISRHYNFRNVLEYYPKDKELVIVAGLPDGCLWRFKINPVGVVSKSCVTPELKTINKPAKVKISQLKMF